MTHHHINGKNPSHFHNFMDINESTLWQSTSAKYDFVNRCDDFLKQYNPNISMAIANCLYGRMTSTNLHYHTPVHILSIFDFAKEHEIHLEPWEELAIWFHDSIYNPKARSPDNENDSVTFMKAALACEVNSAIVNFAAQAIYATAEHLSNDVSPTYHKILDLDLCSFADPKVYLKTSELIKKEYGDISIEDYKKGRSIFMHRLLSKGFVFRTDFFKEKFEKIAVNNIMDTLDTCHA